MMAKVESYICDVANCGKPATREHNNSRLFNKDFCSEHREAVLDLYSHFMYGYEIALIGPNVSLETNLRISPQWVNHVQIIKKVVK